MDVHKNRVRIFGVIVLLAMLLSLIFPSTTVFADDTTPPADTSEVTDVPAEDAPSEEETVPEVEAPVGEEPIAEEPTAEELVADEGVTEEPASEEPVAEEASTEEPVAEDTTPEEEAQTEEGPVLTQLPEGTDVVVLDEEGEVVPLATQEAAEAIASSDPMWCPEGVLPGGTGCTANYSSMTDLLTALSGTNQPNQNGTIWIEKTYNSASEGVSGFTFDGNTGNFSTWRDYSLTIQGGWNGPGTTSIDHATPSVFSGDYLRIVNWRNNVTIRDILISGATADDNLEITTTGNVTLENVESSNNPTRRGVIIDNDAGTGTVTVNNSRFIGNGDSGDDGLYISSQGNVTLLNVIATGNKGDGVEITNTASTTSAIVQVLGTTNIFTGNTNGGTGLRIYSEGNVSLNNITADMNAGNGVYIENQTSTTNAVVSFTGVNSFSNNTSNGLYVRSKGAITLSNVTANNSVNDSGVILDNDETGAVGGVTFTGSNSFSGNNDYGLDIDSNGAVSLNNVTANSNTTQYGVNINNSSSDASGDVTITGTNSFSGNDDYGLEIDSRGAVLLNNITADSNTTQDGVDIANGYGDDKDVTLTGTLNFRNNGDEGLYVSSKGNVTMASVVATGNNGYGTDINNTASTTNALVQINGTNDFSGNGSTGLNVASRGAITLSNIVANNSVNDSGAYLFNDYAGSSGGVTITGNNSFSGNRDSGLVIDSRGVVTLTNIVADGNVTATGVSIENCNYSGGVCQGSGDVTLTGTLVFTNNGNNDDGLYISSSGNVSMADVTATGNKDEGVEIYNDRSTTSATVTIGGTNVFTGNTGTGLLIYSKGDVNLNNVTAETNGYGTYIENQNSTTNAAVTISGTNSFNGNTSNGLYIRSKGSITLSNIIANGSLNDSGVTLDNDETGAVGGVTITGTNSFSGNNDHGLLIDSRGAVNLNNIVANGNKTEYGVYIENCNWSGSACLGSGDVTLTGTLAFTDNGNDGNDDGLYISTSGNVSMANVIATGNKDEGVQIYNTGSTSNASVLIDGTNIFTGNTGYGLYVNSKGAITASNVTANGSINDSGAFLDNDETGAAGGVTLTGTNSFSGNYDYGLEIDSRGAVSLINITADNNVTQYGANIYNASTSASGDVTITGKNSFSGNDDYGLYIESRGAVGLNDIAADGNKTSDGVTIDNDSGTGDVTLTGALSFKNNGNGDGDDGLYIDTKGNVTMANVVATGNRDEGVEIYNTDSTTNSFVQISGTNLFSGNTGYGLYVLSKGAIALSNTTADGSIADSGAYLNNNQTGAVGDITVTGTNSFSGNYDYGLEIDSRGAVSLENITANNNVTQYGVNIDNDTTGASGNVTISGANSFSGNDDYGLYVESRGAVSLNDVVADNNKTSDGVFIDNDAGTGDVTINGTNSFSGNGDGNDDDGLYITSQGNILLNSITADGNKNYGAYINNTASSSNATVTIDGYRYSNTAVNSFSNNLDDGLVIRSDGTVQLFEIAANGNGTSSGDRGADIDNSSGNGDVSITGYHNSFSGNAGPGLDIDTRGNIDLYFATIENNNQAGGVGGALFDSSGVTSGAAHVYCSIFGGNSGDGLDAWNYRGSLDFHGMDGFTDYNYNGTAGFNYDSCFIPVYGCTDPKALNYDPNANRNDGSCEEIIYGCMDPTHPNYDHLANVHSGCEEEKPKAVISLIPVTGGQFFPISCIDPMTILQMSNGDQVTFTSTLCGYEAMLDEVLEAGLPDELLDEDQFASGMSVTLRKDGSVVDELPVDAEMTVSFKIPSGMEGESFSILRWDGSQWVEESVTLENGYVKATSSNTGTFVLVVK